MIDVSAQGSCTVTPINPTTLTATGGAITSGTVNVTILCNCTDGDGGVVPLVRWYYPGMTQLTLLNTNSDSPYYIRGSGNTDNTNVILVIPTFNDSYDGTYTCGRRTDTNQYEAPTATVVLCKCW